MVGLLDYDFGELILLLSSLYALYLELSLVWLYCQVWDAVSYPLNQRVMPDFL